MKQRKDPILNEIEKLTWEEYNCFLFFTYCLGLISLYGLNINSENPEALFPSYTPDSREDVLAIIRIGLKDKELEEIIFELKVNLNLIKKYYDEYKYLCDIDMQSLLADKSKLGSPPFVEEDLFNDLRLDFFGEYPNEQHLVEKYILGK